MWNVIWFIYIYIKISKIDSIVLLFIVVTHSNMKLVWRWPNVGPTLLMPTLGQRHLPDVGPTSGQRQTNYVGSASAQRWPDVGPTRSHSDVGSAVEPNDKANVVNQRRPDPTADVGPTL